MPKLLSARRVEWAAGCTYLTASVPPSALTRLRKIQSEAGLQRIERLWATLRNADYASDVSAEEQLLTVLKMLDTTQAPTPDLSTALLTQIQRACYATKKRRRRKDAGVRGGK